MKNKHEDIDLKFIGSKYRDKEEYMNILEEYDDLMIDKLKFLNEMYTAESTLYAMWRIYKSKIHKFELMYKKDLGYFSDDECHAVVESAFNSGLTTQKTVATFINNYRAWSSINSNVQNQNKIKVIARKNIDTARKLLKRQIIDLDTFYNIIYELEDKTTVDYLAICVLARYGIIGKEHSWAINLKYRDIDFKNKIVKIYNPNTGMLITKLPVDERFLQYMSRVFKKQSESIYMDKDSYVLINVGKNKRKQLAKSGMNNRYYIINEYLGEKRFNSTDLKKSRVMDLLLYTRKMGRIATDDIRNVCQILYAREVTLGYLAQIREMYYNITGEKVLNPMNTNINKMLEKDDSIDPYKNAKEFIGFKYNSEYFNFSEPSNIKLTLHEQINTDELEIEE